MWCNTMLAVIMNTWYLWISELTFPKRPTVLNQLRICVSNADENNRLPVAIYLNSQGNPDTMFKMKREIGTAFLFPLKRVLLRKFWSSSADLVIVLHWSLPKITILGVERYQYLDRNSVFLTLDILRHKRSLKYCKSSKCWLRPRTIGSQKMF